MTSEERAVWIGEKLELLLKWEKITYKIRWLGRESMTAEDIFEAFAEWLSSPDGIHDVKSAIIDRGYSMHLDYNAENKEWCCDFFFPKGHQGKHGETEAEAVLAACEKSLMSEEYDR